MGWGTSMNLQKRSAHVYCGVCLECKAWDAFTAAIMRGSLGAETIGVGAPGGGVMRIISLNPDPPIKGYVHVEWATPIFVDDSGNPPPSGPSKPYNEAVSDVHRYLKEVVEKLPTEHADGSVKEGVQSDLDKAIKDRGEQKAWPTTI